MTTERESTHAQTDLLDRVRRVILKRKLDGDKKASIRNATDEALEMWLVENEEQ